jgi:hypothetical protein
LPDKVAELNGNKPSFFTMNCCGPASWLARKQPQECRQIGASILCLYSDFMASDRMLWHPLDVLA